MVVIGRNFFVIFGVHGRTCGVEPFNPYIGTIKKAPIIDAAVAYNCPYTHETYLLIAIHAFMLLQLIIIALIPSSFGKRESMFVTLIRYIFLIQNQEIMLLHLLTPIYEYQFLFGLYFLSFTP